MIKRHTKNHGTSIKVGFMICFIFVVGVYNEWPEKNARQGMTAKDNFKPLG
ncbi:MAG: hypothetical protein ACYDHG_17305 [Desulfomonilaceae bacterium]